MGTWGTGPFDNDGACEFVASLHAPIERVLRRKTKAYYYYGEARAAAKLISIAAGRDMLGGPNLAPAIEVLERIRGDAEWIGTWDKPRLIRAALTREIRELRRLAKLPNTPLRKLSAYVAKKGKKRTPTTKTGGRRSPR
jgi:hypothetical protein